MGGGSSVCSNWLLFQRPACQASDSRLAHWASMQAAAYPHHYLCPWLRWARPSCPSIRVSLVPAARRGLHHKAIGLSIWITSFEKPIGGGVPPATQARAGAGHSRSCVFSQHSLLSKAHAVFSRTPRPSCFSGAALIRSPLCRFENSAVLQRRLLSPGPLR